MLAKCQFAAERTLFLAGMSHPEMPRSRRGLLGYANGLGGPAGAAGIRATFLAINSWLLRSQIESLVRQYSRVRPSPSPPV